jgi:mannose-1-phosphate guanylyltransferase/mannose-6-phosphate isomerase
MKIVPVILCGGIGSRLWPLSREAYPKQLTSFSGKHSLFQDTVGRATSAAFAKPVVVTSNEHRFLIAEQLRTMGRDADILLEPMRRDSCAAIAAAAFWIARTTPDALMLVLAADHAIPETEAFLRTVSEGAPAAEAGHIVAFGIRPSHPATGYGYIRPGDGIAGIPGVHRLEAFVEKPDRETASLYVAQGYLWNSGNFLVSAATFLAELAALAPDIHGPLQAALENGRQDLDFYRLDAEAFAKARSQSVDYAVMEKTAKAAVVPADFTWSDIGSWAAVHDLAGRDNRGNASVGDALFLDSSDSYIHSPKKLTAVVGMKDAIVVSTADVTLVASRQSAEKVKDLVAELARAGRSEVLDHSFTYRPWGMYERIAHGTRYQVKRIVVNPGGALSLQSHFHRAEHWVVVTGTARVTIDDRVVLLGENESIYIPSGSVHRLENPGRIAMELIEVQSGSYLGEDDIVRYEDIYNRS